MNPDWADEKALWVCHRLQHSPKRHIGPNCPDCQKVAAALRAERERGQKLAEAMAEALNELGSPSETHPDCVGCQEDHRQAHETLTNALANWRK